MDSYENRTATFGSNNSYPKIILLFCQPIIEFITVIRKQKEINLHISCEFQNKLTESISRSKRINLSEVIRGFIINH